MNALTISPPELIPAFIHGEAPAESDGGFVIDDERKAAWASTKILAARHRMTRRRHLADDYQNRILNWLDRANEPDQRSLAFLENSLRPWVEEQVSRLSRSRSVLLPGVRVGLRKSPDRVEVLDLESVLTFCEEHLPELIVTKKDVSKSDLKKHLTQGARIPGTTLIPGNEELTVVEDGKGAIDA